MPTNDPTSGMPPMIGRRLSIPEWLTYVAGYDFGPIAVRMRSGLPRP